MPDTKTCPNCGENLTGNFCANCGQKAKNLNVRFKELISEVVGDIFTFDSRFFRTLIPLITKPGFLTVEYNLGRRSRYVTPFKLYIFISFILFFMLNTIDVKIVKFTKGLPKTTELSSPAADSLKTKPSKPAADSLGTVKNLQRQFFRKLAQQEDSIKQINTAVVKRLPQLMFFLMPVFALLLKLFYRRSKRLYLSHLIFAIHFHVFVFLVLIVRLLIYIITESQLSAVLLVFIPLYLFQGLKRAYTENFFMRSIKSFGLFLIYFSILLCSLLVLIIITIMLF